MNPPDAPTTDSAPARFSTAWIFLAAFLLGALVLALRFPDRIFHPQLRDEDGFIFFRQEAIYGFKSLQIKYSGYYLALQRLVAYAAGFLHPVWTPWVYNWAAFLMTAAVCGRIAVAGLPAAWRAGFIALFVLHPFCIWNAIHLTNVFWFTAVLFPLFAIERAPQSLFGKSATFVVTAVLGMSGPFAAFFAPLFVLRAALLDRSRYSLALGATVVATGVAQAISVITSPRYGTTTETGAFHLADVWTLANRFAVRGLFVNFADEGSVFQSILAFGILGLFAAGAFMALRRSEDRKRNARVAMLVASSALMYVAGIFATLGPWLDVMPGSTNTRYYILPWVLFGWAIVAIASAPGWRWMRLPTVALLLVMPLTAFRAAPFPPSNWAKDLKNVEAEGYGFLRLYPAGEHRHLFAARGEGRYGFARGEEYRRYLDPNHILPRAFNILHAGSASKDAPVFVYLHDFGDREGIVTFSRSQVGLVIPEGATAFQGSYGFAPLAIPPDQLGSVAGGDGILIRIQVSDGKTQSQAVLQEFMQPASAYDPEVRRHFRVEIPPGPWKVLFIDNLQGPTVEHSPYFDFALWSDLAFLAKKPEPAKTEPPSP